MRPIKHLCMLIGVLCTAQALAQALPPEVDAALTRAKLPHDAIAMLVVEAGGKASPRLAYRAIIPMNPASVTKLVTTYAALDLLGPAFTWATPVYVDGALQGGVLKGNVYIKGQGDPKLVLEQLWLLLRRVQGLGIKSIAGDIVLDHSAFAATDTDPASFDGDPLRAYNAVADALLINFKSVVMRFVPDRTGSTAHVSYEPPLAGVQMQASVPLSNVDCGDYRGALKADLADPSRIRFAGSYPSACGEKAWPLAYAEPRSFATRAVDGMWREMGGKLSGAVREGRVPASLAPSFEHRSAPLAELIRDINKYSNNVMAQQLFLTLALQARDGAGALQHPQADAQAARAVLGHWWKTRISADDMPILDNGSGLSRQTRISAAALARLLQAAYASPLMPELMSSLPITGVDGTLKKTKGSALGRAHLKTGSLNDVTATAGYVHAASGKTYVLVAMANHAGAPGARPALDALVEWTVKDN